VNIGQAVVDILRFLFDFQDDGQILTVRRLYVANMLKVYSGPQDDGISPPK